ADASFDTVVSTFPSEFIYDPDTIAEVERVLRPAGRLIVIEGANLLPVGFLQPLLVLMQVFVYGPAAVFGPRKRTNLDEEMAHNLTAIADRNEINDHDRCEHTCEYIGVEAQFDGVNAKQCESHADQQRDGQHDVETLGLPGLLGETSGPAEGVSHSIGTTG